jgi:enoyl-CoA hydratase
MTDILQVWRGEGRHEITLNRPRRRNAINRELNTAIVAALRAFDGDADACVAVLTGADPAFCAGMDLSDLSWAIGPRVDTFASALRAVRKPVIAAVNGPAITGGFGLALGADFILASERAFFGDTHARVGVFPGGGMTVYLAQAVGVRRARQLSYTGELIDAAEALRLGLANEVLPHAGLLPRLAR